MGWCERTLFICGLCLPIGCGAAQAAPFTAQEAVQAEQLKLPVSRVERGIQRLLLDAHAALVAGRLTEPAHNNAFDRFQAVLLLAPDHPQAISGIQHIALRYLSMVRKAMAENKYNQAHALLQRARLVGGTQGGIGRYQIEQLADEIKRVRDREKSRLSVVAENEYPLVGVLLDRRANVIVDQLKEIAAQVRRLGRSLLIVARSDAEGRWIYRQMKRAVPGFRLRGDIKLGKRPKVLLLPAID